MATSRRNFIRVLAGSGLVLGAGAIGLTRCDRMPGDAVAVWGGPGPGETEPRRRALAFALLAPNPHNMQPWIADLREDRVITFYCDRTRLLPETDPPSRQIMIGCGAFLDLLQMAAAADGWRAHVTLFPEGPWPDGEVGEAPLARVEMSPDPARTADPLFAHALTRRTNRAAYGAEPPAAAEMARLDAAVSGLGLRFGWTAEPARVAALRDLAARAWEVEVTTDATYFESVKVYRITAPEISAHRDGIPLHGPMMWWLSTLGLFSRERAMTGDAFLRDQARSVYGNVIAATPAFAWLISPGNDRAMQLASGAAYLRMNLAATPAGLAMQPLSQALQEFPQMAGPYAEMKAALGAREDETVQMFVRIGAAAPASPSPRRPLDALLKT